MAPRPVTVVSGFLGSGKTTMLRRALREPGRGGVAVIVNELGEIGLDQHQFTHVAERTILLGNGCLCCATRDDLRETLRELLEAERAGAATLERVVLETSGLADPAPILATVDRDPMLRHQFAVDRVLVTCDAEHAPLQRRRPEWQAQIAAADTIALTKSERVEPQRAAAVEALAASRNPIARIVAASSFDPFAGGATRGRVAPPPVPAAPGKRHTEGASTASVRVTGELDPARIVVWLSALLHAHGARLLRVKALIDVGDRSGPLVVDVVGHVVYPPRHLECWEGERASSLVAICSDGLDAGLVTDAFAALARNPSPLSV